MTELTAVVTGASSGIGKAIYEGLKDDFDVVVGVSRRGPDKFIDVRMVSDKMKPIVSRVDLLVNCAGIMPLDEDGREHEIFDTNFWGTYNMIRNLMPSFSMGACVINIASVSGMVNDPDVPIYSASKAAVISLTKSLAKRHAPYIRFNCISPGFFRTNLVPGETPKELIEKIPLKYEERPEVLVRVVKMIYEIKYMTGTNIVVDGGLSA